MGLSAPFVPEISMYKKTAPYWYNYFEEKFFPIQAVNLTCSKSHKTNFRLLLSDFLRCPKWVKFVFTFPLFVFCCSAIFYGSAP